MTVVEPLSDEVVEQLQALEQRRIRALLDVDVATLDELFDDRLIHIHAPGVVQNKAQLLEHVATRQAYVSIERGELTIRVTGPVAVITGSISNRLGSANGKERTVEGVVTQVVVQGAEGVWRYLSFQMTPYGEQAWGALPSELAQQATAPEQEAS